MQARRTHLLGFIQSWEFERGMKQNNEGKMRLAFIDIFISMLILDSKYKNGRVEWRYRYNVKVGII